MQGRKVWTQKEDSILKYLKQQRNIKKWGKISEILKSEFDIIGKSGKQCRQRFLNHIDSKVSVEKWSNEENLLLINLHNRLGNKWALIARSLSGRTDNCVKNHFYCQFRRAVRVVNELIKQNFKRSQKILKTNLINKITKIIQSHHKNLSPMTQELFQCAQSIKEKILEFCSYRSENVKDLLNIKLTCIINEIKKFNAIHREFTQSAKNERSNAQNGIEKQIAANQKFSLPIPDLSSFDKQSGQSEIYQEQQNVELLDENSTVLVNKSAAKQNLACELREYSDIQVVQNGGYFDLADLYNEEPQFQF